MNNKRQASKGSVVIWVIILLVIMIYNLAGDFSGDFDPNVLVPVFIGIAFAVFFAAIVITIARVKTRKSGEKKKSAVELHRPFPQPTAVKTRQPARVLQHKDEAEEVVTCAHRTGREKYLEQVEGFYKNGLIDREEYKTLQAKYEKLEIPDDYH